MKLSHSVGYRVTSSGTPPLEMKAKCNTVYQDSVPAYDKESDKFICVLPT